MVKVLRFSWHHPNDTLAQDTGTGREGLQGWGTGGIRRKQGFFLKLTDARKQRLGAVEDRDLLELRHKGRDTFARGLNPSRNLGLALGQRDARRQAGRGSGVAHG